MKYKKFVIMVLVYIAIVLMNIIIYSCERNNNCGIYNLFHGKSKIIIELNEIKRILIYIFMGICFGIIYKILDKIQIIVKINKKEILKVRKDFIWWMLAIYIVITCCTFFRSYIVQLNINTIRNLINEDKVIVHALGFIEGGVDKKVYSYTNSKEALINSYSFGNRIFEVDFCFTSDNALVCAHNGNSWVAGIETEGILSEKDFLNQKIYGYFTPMSLDDLAEFMIENEEMYVVTDIKSIVPNANYNGCKYIKDNYPQLQDRFIIQIYHIDEYEPIKKEGFNNIIFTLYETSETERKPEVLKENFDKYDLLGLTFWDSWCYGEWFEQIKELNVPLYIHTVNDKNEMISAYKKGISAIYTDNVVNEWIKKEDY